MSTGAHIPSRLCFQFFGVYTRGGGYWSHGDPMFWLHYFNFRQRCRRIPVSPCPPQHWLLFVFYSSQPNGSCGISLCAWHFLVHGILGFFDCLSPLIGPQLQDSSLHLPRSPQIPGAEYQAWHKAGVPGGPDVFLVCGGGCAGLLANTPHLQSWGAGLTCSLPRLLEPPLCPLSKPCLLVLGG